MVCYPLLLSYLLSYQANDYVSYTDLGYKTITAESGPAPSLADDTNKALILYTTFANNLSS